MMPATAGGLSAPGLPLERAAGSVGAVGDGDDRIRSVVPPSANGESGRTPLAWADRALELRLPKPGGGGDDSEPPFLVHAPRRPDPAVPIGEGI